MVTLLFQQEKKQKTLSVIFVVFLLIILITLSIHFRGKILELIKAKEVTLSSPEMVLEKIEINFEIFQHPLLKILQPFEKLPEFKGTPGRENPFSPYSLPKP